MSFAWKGFHSFGGGFSPSFGPSLTGGVTPIGSWDASTSTLAQLAALVSHSRTSLATMFDSTGKLTYAPNNLLTYSNTFSNAAWAKTAVSIGGTTPGPNGLTGTLIVPSAAYASHYIGQSVTTSSNAIIWAIAKGDGTYSAITLSNTPNNYVHFNLLNGAVSTMGTGWTSGGTTSLGSGWYLCWAVQQTATNFANAYFFPLDAFIANGNTPPTFTGNGTNGVYIAATGVSAVTYETTPRTADQVITTAAAYYGPRIDYDPNTLAVKGLLIEEARTNLLVNSKSDGTNLATQNVTVTAQPYTLTFYGTGSVTLSGASTSGPLSGSGAFPTRSTLTFTPSAGTLTLTVAGTVQYAQLEAGSFATSYIPTAAASVTRASDALTAASLTTNPAIIQLRDISTGTRSRKVINPWSGISSEIDEEIEAIRIYPSGTSGTYLNTKLTVDGPW